MLAHLKSLALEIYLVTILNLEICKQVDLQMTIVLSTML
jgi:hypothetical protein